MTGSNVSHYGKHQRRLSLSLTHSSSHRVPAVSPFPKKRKETPRTERPSHHLIFSSSTKESPPPKMDRETNVLNLNITHASKFQHFPPPLRPNFSIPFWFFFFT